MHDEASFNRAPRRPLTEATRHPCHHVIFPQTHMPSVIPDWPSRRFLLAALACAFLACSVFLPGLSGGFIFDDTPNIVTNYLLHVTSLHPFDLIQASLSFHAGGGSRPLAMLTFALDHWRAGLDPQAFKTTSLVVHAITTAVLAVFLRKLLLLAAWSPRRAAFAALALALLWAVHPLQVSSVLYVVQRMQTLATLFLLLALLGYLHGRDAQMRSLPAKRYWYFTGIAWLLALASKEDAVLLPAYALLLELTILKFAAADEKTALQLRKGALALGLAGLALYLLVAVPHYWTWEPYSTRDFNSYERLLTQGRMLVMYLGQILLPLPENLPFYYDDLVVSRSLTQPATTLPALGLIAALLALAVALRHRAPVFSFGLLFFFAGHFTTSNVIGLEMAFEHRNHLPLVGALLALADLLRIAADRFRLPVLAGAFVVVAVTLASAGLAWKRAEVWGDPLRLAQESTRIAPDSVRAWILLCDTHYSAAELKPEHPSFDLAIESCEAGSRLGSSAVLLANLVTLKSINGSIEPKDWERLNTRLRQVTLNNENRNIVWGMVNAIQGKLPVDGERALETIAIITGRSPLNVQENIAVATALLRDGRHPEAAYPYLVNAVTTASKDDPAVARLLADLDRMGRSEWAERLRAMSEAKHASSGM
ncbi:hypothetical protein OS176_02125 [Xanthomonadaceae bacterium XH05]|nr:hypothetical protein [Xanthomonadaceae bacterium XH05]